MVKMNNRLKQAEIRLEQLDRSGRANGFRLFNVMWTKNRSPEAILHHVLVNGLELEKDYVDGLANFKNPYGDQPLSVAPFLTKQQASDYKRRNAVIKILKGRPENKGKTIRHVGNDMIRFGDGEARHYKDFDVNICDPRV